MHRFTITIPIDLLETIDGIRRERFPIPSRSEVARELIEIGAENMPHPRTRKR